MSLKLLGSQAACGTNVAGASTFSGAPNVRLFNSGSTIRLITVANSADATLATVSLAGGEVIVLKKSPDDQVFAAHAEILGVGCITEN